MSVYETIQVVLSGGMFIIALVTLIVKILNSDKKN
ncbi:putative holin-like toxin [Vagococcus allomyrinae]